MKSKYFHTMILAGGLALSLVGFSAAQTSTGNPQGASPQPNDGERDSDRGHGGRGGMKSLGLSDSQKAQLKGIREDAKKQRDAIKNDSSLSENQKKAKLKELRTATRGKVDSVLTPEQREKMKQLRKEHHHGRGKRRSENGGQR